MTAHYLVENLELGDTNSNSVIERVLGKKYSILNTFFIAFMLLMCSFAIFINLD